MKCSTAPFNPCPTIPNAQCVVYTGPNLPNINVTTNMRLDTILNTLNSIVNDFEFNLFTEDSLTVDFSGDGSSNTPLTADVIVSDVGNNSILILDSGLYVPNSIQNGVVLGGIVTWLQDYEYHVSPAVYYINGVRFDQRDDFPSGFTFTLDPPDGTYNRIDTFAVNTDGFTEVLPGTPSIDPAQAPLDTASQLELSLALVEVGTTEPTIDVECLYKNNLESPLWINTTSNSTRLNPDSTNTPCNGTKSIEGTAVVTNDNILFTRSSNFIPGASHSLATFLIRSKGFSGNNNFMRLQWEFNGTPVGTSVALRNLAFGFQGLDTTSCQIVSIPFSFFGLTSTSIVNSFRMTGSIAQVGGIGFYIDDLCLQGQPLPGAPTNADEKVKVSSNDTTAGYLNGKLVAGAGVTLTENNNGANETLSISVTTTLSADNGLSESPTNNVQLGGNPLLFDTVIPTSGFHLTITSSSTSHTLQSNNSGNAGSAVVGLSSGVGGAGIVGSSQSATSGYGGSFTSVAGIGTLASGPLGSQTTAFNSGTTNVIPISVFQRTTTGTAANGIGGSIDLKLDTDAGNLPISNQIITKYTSAADLARTSQLSFTGYDGGTLKTSLILNGDGSAQLPEYGAGTFTGTDTFWLAVDTDGNVIEMAAPSGGGSVTADNGLTINPSGNVQLGATTSLGADLLHESYIDAEGFGLTINGIKSFTAEAHNAVFTVKNRYTGGDGSEGVYIDVDGSGSTGLAITSENTGATIIADSIGIFAQSDASGSTSGQFITAGTNGTGILVSATGGGNSKPIVSYVYGTNHNDVNISLELHKDTISATPPDDGIGQAIDFICATDANSQYRANRIISKWSDAFTANRTSQFILSGVGSAIEADLFTLTGTGALQLNKYGLGNFVGTETYILAVDVSGNVIEVDPGTLGGGGSITADNGLTMSTSTNAQLGGSLLQDTVVAAGAFQMDFTGSHANYVLGVDNNTAGTAIDAQSTGGTAVLGNGVLGGVFTGVTGVTGITTTNGGLAGVFSGTFSGTNTNLTVLDVQRHTSGTPAAGMGGKIQYTLEATASTMAAGTLGVIWTDPVSATATSRFDISLLDTGVAGRKLSLSGAGQLSLDEYGTGTFTGTDAYWLAVDSSGNIIEKAAPTTFTGITADNGLSVSSSSNTRLGGSALLANTSILTSAFSLTINSSHGVNTLAAVNTGSGSGVSGSSAALYGVLGLGTAGLAVGVYGSAGSGVGVVAESTTGGTGLYAKSQTGLAAIFLVNPSTTSTVDQIMKLQRTSTGTPSNGIGGYIGFEVGYASGLISEASRIATTWSNVTTRNSTLDFYTKDTNVLARKMSIAGTGRLTLDTYGTGAITGGSPTFALNVDAAGNVIEAAIGSGMTNPMGAIGDIITSSDGSGTPAAISPGAAGTVLTSNGAGAQPTWQAGAGGSGIVRVVASTASPLTLGSTALTDYVYLVSGTTTVTLPTAVGNSNRYTVINVGVNTVTIATTGGQSIEGLSPDTLTNQFESVDLISDGSNWFVI